MAADPVSSRGIVHEYLTEANYECWKACVKNYLEAQDLWDIVEYGFDPEDTGRDEFNTWKKQNAMALHVIQLSCGPQMLKLIWNSKTAESAWKSLEESITNLQQTQGVVSAAAGPIQEEKDGQEESVLEKQGTWQESENTDMNNIDYEPLIKAVENGDWEDAEVFLNKHPEAVRARITKDGDTALHLATYAGRTRIVRKLVEKMEKGDLEIQNFDGETAFIIAVYHGNILVALSMSHKNGNLVRIKTKDGDIPLLLASPRRHPDMLRYLYCNTFKELIQGDQKRLAMFLNECIAGEKLDVALHLTQQYLVTSTSDGLDPKGVVKVFREGLVALSQVPSAFPSGAHLAFWQRWFYSCIHVHLDDSTSLKSIKTSFLQLEQVNIIMPGGGKFRFAVSVLCNGIKKIYKKKLIHLQACKLVDLFCKQIKDESKGKTLRFYRRALFQAAKLGIEEVVLEILKANPEFHSLTDHHKRNIFQIAIVNRQEKIFSLIYGFEGNIDSITSAVDRCQNNMLHLAAMLAPSSRMNHISGAALQMQRELQWFKEVESIMHPSCKEEKNKDGKTPHELFTESHTNLMKEGEKWMKETAASCTVAAALIVTIMFAAAFTVPGGNGGLGTPIFLRKGLFMVFIIADALSFFSSSTSVLMFLRILTSRYSEKRFLKTLPRNMMIGLCSLFISIANMVIAYCVALHLILQGQPPWFFILITLFASVPVTLFVFLQFPLLLEIFISTYGSSIFNKKPEHWY